MIVKDAELRDNPPATDRRPARRAAVRAAARVQRATGPRCTTSCAGGGTIADSYDPPAAAARRDPGRRRWPTLGALLRRGPRRAPARVQLPVHQRAVRSRPRCGRSWRAIEAAAPAGRVAGVDGLEPRHVPLRDALGARRPAPGPRRARDAARAPRHARAVPGRRDRPRRRRGRSRRTCATRSACGTGRRTRGATRCARRCTGATAPGGGFTEPGVRPWLPLGDTERATSKTSAGSPDRSSPWLATSSRSEPGRPICPSARTGAPGARGRLGLAARRRPPRRGQLLGARRGPRGVRRPHPDRHRSLRVTGSRSRSLLLRGLGGGRHRGGRSEPIATDVTRVSHSSSVLGIV